MQFAQVVSVITVLLLSLWQFTECKKQQDIQIIVQSKPEDCSRVAQKGDEVAVHYTGYLDSGAVFDSSVQQNRDPLKFVLGQRKVIQGWEQGIEGMCVGEKRKLIIPPHLAYGKQGHPPVIPAEATLTFETELVAVGKPSSEFNLVKTAQFLALPALILYVVYYLYDKYRKESSVSGAKDSKEKRKKRK